MIDSPQNSPAGTSPDEGTAPAATPSPAKLEAAGRAPRPPELGGLIRSLRGRWTLRVLESEERLAGVWLVGVRPGRRRSA
jgi:hypothetical protein